MLWQAFVTFFCVFMCANKIAFCVPVDNGVEGFPQLDCGPDDIGVLFNTMSPFEGHIFVKGRFTDPDCRIDGEGVAPLAEIRLKFRSCGVTRIRSLNPRGVFVTAQVIVSFHPSFITKVDRAYTLQCFYMEASKTVEKEVEVSMLTTSFQTEGVPMPVCRYEIVDQLGMPVHFAVLGQKVYHKWTCESTTVETFCMRVHSCFVDDGAGDRLDLIDPNGCALDRHLISNLQYPTDLMAMQETHVFKYADRPLLFFQCQITVEVKEPGLECSRPTCIDPILRGKRQAAMPSHQWRHFTEAFKIDENVLDVAYRMSALDILPQNDRVSDGDPLKPDDDILLADNSLGGGDTVCLTFAGLFSAMLFAAIGTVCAIVAAFALFRRIVMRVDL